MHELSAMQDILERVNREIKDKKARKVLSVKIRIGELRGLSREHFLEDWKMLIKGTGLEKTKMEIQMVPPKAHCKACGEEIFLNKFSMVCPHCGSPEVKIVSGKELELESITVK